MVKPIGLRNLEDGTETRDRLHTRAATNVACTAKVCLGSLMSSPAPKRGTKPKTPEEVVSEAEAFLEEFYADKNQRNEEAHRQRVAQVKEEVARRGTYEQTYDEITFGAKLAWRNAPRCIGRIQWSNLKLFDARHARTASDMFQCLLEHIKYATNGGNLRSTITVFPQRCDEFHDFVVWNKQLVSYAGYENADGSITGDPTSVDLTKICLKLGWKPKRTEYDVLPLVLQANGQPPEFFPIPDHLALQIDIQHPEYDAFKELGLKWYALPAVANMMLDCGGIEYTGAPFNGWYMSTEIGTRDLCDTYRYNKAEAIATKLKLDTSSTATLWKDKAMLEANRAVLYSFQKKGVTIWDHHTAADTFMQHYEKEVQTRGGCPADWVWLVPPMSGGLSPVFHQELALYYLKPSYEYQEAPWIKYKFDTLATVPSIASGTKDTMARQKLTFRVLSKVARFCATLYVKAVSKRPRVLVLYATESGKSEKYAKRIMAEISRYLFRVALSRMDQYKVEDLSHESIVLFITSTFGNGDPPTNGEAFKRSLLELKSKGSKFQNLRFAVFALGSTAYPQFCAFGKFLDKTMIELGSSSLLEITCGDELKGQDHSFKTWTNQIIQILSSSSSSVKALVSASTFSSLTFQEPGDSSASQKYRLVQVDTEDQLPASLSKAHGTTVYLTRVMERKSWKSDAGEDKTVISLVLETFGSGKLQYEPGDHIAIYPTVPDEKVLALLKRLEDVPEPGAFVHLEAQTSGDSWRKDTQLPSATVLTLLSQFLDIMAPPTQEMLLYWAPRATEPSQMKKLRSLAEDNDFYDNWCSWVQPDILSGLNEFWSVKLPAAELVGTLPLLRPRYYSISSAPSLHRGQIHVTVALASFRTRGGKGPLRYGVCSSYLNDTQRGDFIACHVKSSQHFHLPDNRETPVILVGPGTGVAPFRGFWQQREAELLVNRMQKNGNSGLSRLRNLYSSNKSPAPKWGPMLLYFGCRDQRLHLYADEMERARKIGALSEVSVAYSRNPSTAKIYVQDLIKRDSEMIYKLLLSRQGHLYICGEATMSSQVLAAVRDAIRMHGNMDVQQADYIIQILKEESRIHEDIFASNEKY